MRVNILYLLLLGTTRSALSALWDLENNIVGNESYDGSLSEDIADPTHGRVHRDELTNTTMFTSAVGSVTFFPASHEVRQFEEPALTLFRQVYKGWKVPIEQSELLQTSIPRGRERNFLDNVIPQQNGFVHTIIEAYNNHRALIIRPDDVWLSILTQFNYFVNGNAELLRKHFVAHEGKEKLTVEAMGNRYSVDFAAMSRQMTKLMEKKIVDPDLRDWILPTFTTTTTTDTTVYAMVMMASLKTYFSYDFTLACGIPRVTLEGTKNDWQMLSSRLGKLRDYGKETESWYNLLQPIISRFIAAYGEPNGQENLDFWNKVAHIHSGGSGPRYLSGWITAFCYFNKDGSPTAIGGRGLTLDGVVYPRIDTNNVPPGYAEVDVELDDNGEKFNTTIVAGSIGSRVCGANLARDTVRPLPAWWYFITGVSESPFGTAQYRDSAEL